MFVVLPEASVSVRPSQAPVAVAAGGVAAVDGVNARPFRLVPDVAAVLVLVDAAEGVLVDAAEGVLSELPLKRRDAGEVDVVVVCRVVCCRCVCPGSCRCATTR